MLKKINLWRGSAYLFVSLILISYTAGSILEANINVVDSFLGTNSSKIVTSLEDNKELFTTFVADFSNTDELVAKHQEMGEQLMEEGAVLLKNNGSLPFKEEISKVTLLGLRSSSKAYFGAKIGVSVPNNQNVSLETALNESGFEVNPTMAKIYELLAADERFSKGVNSLSPSFAGVATGEEPSYTIAEPTLDDIAQIDKRYLDSIEQYSDSAIVVIGRPTSEAADFYPGPDGVNAEAGARNVLALSKEEIAMIEFAKNNFESIIVLINSNNPMEIDALKNDEGIDALLWIGTPGNYGFQGLADLLKGEVNPSGALPDVFASDSTSSPAMANFGVIQYENATEQLEEMDKANFYLIEAEGIYTGYRYYETRYADLVMGQGNADSEIGTFDSSGAWTYEEEVTYPFGYGLSYTSFAFDIEELDVEMGDKKITAEISVTNTGSIAGKTSVQLYAQAPYISGGVEKSAVQLLDFGKTRTLDPGETQSIQIESKLDYLASYDENEAKTYILDAGDYFFTVANGSHEAINNILAYQGYTKEDGMDEEGYAEKVEKWTLETDDGVDATIFAVSDSGIPITNQLSSADMNTWQPGTVTYLSRSDWAGTWPKTYDNLSVNVEMLPYLSNDFYEIATSDDTSEIIFGSTESNLTFSDMVGLDYDDPAWKQLLNQLDLQEAILFITKGNRNYQSMESVGFVGGQYTENGPNGFNMKLSTYSNPDSPWYVSEEDPNAEYSTNDMGGAPLMAATFNRDFAYEYGVLWGNDSLFNGLPMIWATGLNLHRHPYNGRNGEYYSEDPILAGHIGLSMAMGGLEKGLIFAPKHFAFNDQESNRNGVAPFMTEQKARELELRSFQIGIEGGILGLMTSFSRIGPTYVGADVALLQNILYGEWGFNGYVVSDMVNPASYMTWKESLIAGTTNFDTTEIAQEWQEYITETSNSFGSDARMLSAIKDRVHNTLYVFAQSNLINSINATSKQVDVNTWWRFAYKSIFVGASTLAFLSVLGYFIAIVKRKRSKEGQIHA